MYAELKARLLRDPQVLKVVATEPEIRVEIKRETIQISGGTLKGGLARLIAEGFFDEATSPVTAESELRKRGQSCSRPNVYKECDNLTTMGFLLKLDKGSYQAVQPMKRNIIRTETA